MELFVVIRISAVVSFPFQLNKFYSESGVLDRIHNLCISEARTSGSGLLMFLFSLLMPNIFQQIFNSIS